MRRLALAAVAAALLAGGAIWSRADAARGSTGTLTEKELGAQLYAANCSACHGIAGAGKTTPGPVTGTSGIAGVGPSLRGVGALAAAFYLSTGYMPLQSPYMQPRRSRVLFNDHQIRSLVSYIASLGRGPAIPHPDPALGGIAEGQALFTENCAGCHQVAAAGGYVWNSVAPPLYEDSPQQIAEAVRIGPNVMPRFSKQRLSDRQVDSLIAYIRYARSPDDRGGWALGHVGPVPEGLVAWFVAAVVLVGVTMTVGRRLT